MTFADADDRLTPDHLQRYAECIEASTTEPDMIIGGYTAEIEEQGGTVRTEVRPIPAGLDKVGFIRSNMQCFMVWSRLFRAESIAGVRFDTRFGNGEDIVYNTECMARASNVATIGMTGYRYAIRCSSEHALSFYSPTLAETRKEISRLSEIVWSQCDLTDAELAKLRTVCKAYEMVSIADNIFKPCSPHSFREKWRIVKQTVFDDSLYTAVRTYFASHNDIIQDKWFRRSLKMRSPFLMTVIYQQLRTEGSLVRRLQAKIKKLRG